MKTKNLINPLLWTLSFTAFLTSTNIVRACGDVVCAASCCGGTGQCCYSDSGCCDNAGNSVPSVLPKVTPAHILDYVQTGSKNYPDWIVLRGATANLVPTTMDQIKGVTVKDLGDGRFEVQYAVNDKGQWTSQLAIIRLKGKASSS